MKLLNLHPKTFWLISLAVLFVALSPLEKEVPVLRMNQDMQITMIPILDATTAGKDIILKFKVPEFLEASEKIQQLPSLWLHLSSGIGSTALKISTKDLTEGVLIPKHFCQAAGWLKCSLYWQQQLIDENKFFIQPEPKAISPIESYVGPPVMVAGGRDYTMMIAVPTDNYDNLMPNKTPMVINEVFKGDLQSNPQPILDGISWKRIVSPKLAGKMNLAASMGEVTTKQKTVEVQPQLAEDFDIEISNVHTYADGNEIITVKTSPIIDEYGNLQADGTLVKFLILNENKIVASSSGTTLNGVASGKFLHPEVPTQWSVQAQIDGIAQSTTSTVEFKSVVESLPIRITDEPLKIVVGPIKNFMDQLIPEGVQVQLSIQESNLELTTMSENGMAVFELDAAKITSGNNQGTIHVLGTVETFKLERE